MTESELVRLILIAFGKTPGIRLFRNSTGFAKDKHGNGVRFGLCVGSSDIIGWRSETVYSFGEGSDPSGTVERARFVALECKTATGRLTPEQAAFLEAVRHAGGIAACVRSVEDAGRALLGDGYDDEARSREDVPRTRLEAHPNPRCQQGPDPQGLDRPPR